MLVRSGCGGDTVLVSLMVLVIHNFCLQSDFRVLKLSDSPDENGLGARCQAQKVLCAVRCCSSHGRASVSAARGQDAGGASGVGTGASVPAAWPGRGAESRPPRRMAGRDVRESTP